MQDKECLELFENHLINEKKASKNTTESYLRDIRQLADYLESETADSLDSATESDLAGYIAMLREEGKSVATVSRAIASIKNFYFQLTIKGAVKNNPSLKLRPDKCEKKVPDILTNEEINLLLSQPECVDAKGYRDHAMLETMYATGMRVSELLSLDVSDVLLDAGLVRCRANSKERLIPLYDTAVNALNDYITLVRPQMLALDDDPALFVNVSGERMSRQGFWKVLKHYAKKAGIEKDITPHTLRHSFAAHLVENGVDMHSLQELMGFSDVSSGNIYSKMSHSSLRDIYNRAHPMAI